LFVKGELQCGEWEIAKYCSLVAVKERRKSFSPDDGPGRIDGTAVIVAGMEEWILILALKLQAGL
jgi:hypothetical protein